MTNCTHYQGICDHLVCPRASDGAAHQLQLALTRYERLSSPPRWMTVPYCSDLASYERALSRSLAAGNRSRANEIQSWIGQELRRRELLAQWGGASRRIGLEGGENWRGRTLYAWQELLCRLWQARSAAVEAGILDRTSQTYAAISDRIRDVEHRIAVAKRREAMGEPAVA